MAVELFDSYEDAGIQEPRGSGWQNQTCPRCSAGRSTAAHRKQKCLSVHVEDQNWYCQHCEWNGMVRRKDWRERARLAPKFTRPEAVENPELTEKVVNWFAKRGIGRAVLERNGVYWGEWVKADPETGEISKRSHGIAYPFTRGGEVVTIKYRFAGKGHAMTEGAEQIPFGLDDVIGAETVVIVEGEPDKLAVEEATGITAVLSPPNGANVSDRVQEQIAEAVSGARRVLLAGDMDEPGQKMLEALARRIGYDRCWNVTWPEKDANDTLMAHGAEAVQACLDGARPYPVKGIVRFDDLRDLVSDLYDNGMPGGMSTGWSVLDQFYTVAAGEFTIVTAAPGSGKTRFLDALLYNLSDQGARCGFCSMETMPIQRHVARLLPLHVGKPFREGWQERMTKAEMWQAFDELQRRFVFVMPEQPSVDTVLETALVAMRREGLDALVIDPWNRLDRVIPSGVPETSFINDALSGMQRFAVNHGLHIFLVAHPRKLEFEKDNPGEYRVATPYDISGSAAFFNIADNCLSVWRSREDETKPVQVHIQKIRNDENGNLGKVRFTFDKATGRYEQLLPKLVQFSGRPFPRESDDGNAGGIGEERFTTRTFAD